MNAHRFIVMAISFIASLMFLFGCAHTTSGADKYAPGELLLKFKAAVGSKRAEEIISGQGAVIIKYIDAIRVYHIRLRGGQSVAEAIKLFSAYPEVEYAEPNYRYELK